MKRSFSILLFFSAIVFLTACKGTSSQTSYTVSFHLNGGSGSVESQTIIEGECATEPSTIPTKNGYEFNFWGLKTGSEATAFNFSTPIYANTKLYANWITIYTVTFNVNGGSGTVASQTVTSGGSATAPATSPTRSGYNFSFWSTSNTSGATAFDFSSAITADTTLYAIWTQTASEEDSGSSGTQENELEEDSETSGNDNQQVTSYTVTFNVNGGSGTVASQTVTSGGSATAPATSPTRSGYSFSFWSTSNASGATAFDFSSAITADTTLYAIWTQVTYTVTFNVNGGTGTVASQTITSGGSATAPTTNPTRTGYTFSFWSTSNASGATAFDFSSAITANTTLYAIWTSDGTWLTETSLYETYQDYFDYIGFAVEYGIANYSYKELYYEEIQNGIARHANTISLGNEFKPQFILSWWNNNPTVTSESFEASNGVTLDSLPEIKGWTTVDNILTICKNLGIKMRGHVLLWHSQTDEAFFRDDWTSSGDLVTADVMDARLEWYIKTVLNHVAEWEETNNGGEHIIWAWDVINEVTSDSSTSSAATSSTDYDWLRTSGSNWYTIYNDSSSKTNYFTGEAYKSYDFIINAFRFAEKYAPSDVKLCYNDYGGLSGTYTSYKHQSQLRVVDLILAHESDTSFPTRLDAMGLQSHYNVKNSASAYQTEIQDFIAKGIDVQITELDIATCADYDAENDTVGASGAVYTSLAAAYKAFFEMYIDNRKTSSSHGVDSVTIWGIYDEATWLNSTSQIGWIGNCIQYPLLFKLVNNVSTTTTTITTSDGGTTLGTLQLYDNGDSFSAKPAFYAVLEAAE